MPENLIQILPTLFFYLAVCFAGAAGSFIGGITSGGGGVISMSILLMLGINPQVVVGSSRFGSLGFTLGTLFEFYKNNKIRYEFVWPLVAIIILGSTFGAYIVLNIDTKILSKVIGLMIVLLVPIVLWRKDLGLTRYKTTNKKMMLGYFLYAFLSVYEGFLGVGAGILAAYLFVIMFGMSFTEANATEKVPQLVNVVITTFIFAWNGIIDYKLGAVLFVGSLVGGTLGAKFAIKKGDKIVKFVFVAVAIISGIQFIFFA